MESFLNLISKKEVYGLIAIIVLIIISDKILNKLLDKSVERGKTEFDKKKRKTVINLYKNIKKYAILAIGVLFILDLYGVNISTLVASLGVASALVALALQDTLKDIISGSNIIMDNYYVVGDIIKYKDFTGTVIQMGLRTTKIKDFNGQVYTIANRNIDEIINLSQKSASPLITIPTAYEEPIEKVEKILNEVIDEICTWTDVDTENTKYVGIMEFADSSVNYGIRINCKNELRWKYQFEALRLIKQKYDENDIKIPYTQVEVHNAK